MKKQIFEAYLKEVCRVSGLSEAELFKESKKTKHTRPRHMLIYLCIKYGMMSVKELQGYLAEKGFDTPHSNINYARNVYENRMINDQSLYVITKKIASNVEMQ